MDFAGPEQASGPISAQKCVHNSSAHASNIVHNLKYDQTWIQDQCLWQESLLETGLPRGELRVC